MTLPAAAPVMAPPPPPGPVRRGGRHLVLSLGAGLVACYLTGLAVLNLASTPQGSALNSIFPHLGPPLGPGSSLDLRSLNAAWAAIQREYVIRGVAGGAGTQGAEKGLVDMLRATPELHDRFSAFLTRDQAAELHADLGGERSGSIGISLEPRCAGGRACAPGTTPTEILIEKVLHGQPAEAAGLRNGDVLVAVDGRRLRVPLDAAAPADQDARRIRGRAGTTVQITVSREGRELTVTARRGDLHIPSVYSRRFGLVLYMQVTAFNSDTAAAARSQLASGLAGGATSIVLDLRQNGGGFVSAAQSLASQFLALRPGVQEDVVVRRGRLASADRPDTAEQVSHDRIQAGGAAVTPRLVVLVDGGSASASEIVAAALHDYHRATLVGERTLGKGSVQLDLGLPDGSDLHLTVERWYGPGGESIDEKGVAPDTPVALATPDLRYQLDAQSAEPAQDPQLLAALGAAQ